MCMGGAAAPTLTPQQMTDEALQTKVESVNNPIFSNPRIKPSWIEKQKKSVEPYQAEIDNRQQIKDNLAQLAAERDKAISDMAADQKRIQQEADDARNKAITDLQVKQEESQRDLAARSLASQAASQSLRILGIQSRSRQAPSAQLTLGGRGNRRVRPAAGPSSLRIGESRQSSGVGVNLGG